ncbi:MULTISPECIES: hypothetical protein [Paenibacillus]|uniref:hypothetical protein n=1 Tax=Paenibacillus TaxID=44249 RepID=UPI0013E3626D|nr:MULTISPECIES: hypothetical protein [Paenibacillus]
MLTEAADPCLIPVDFFVVSAGQDPRQLVGRKRFTVVRGEVVIDDNCKLRLIKSTAGEV